MVAENYKKNSICGVDIIHFNYVICYKVSKISWSSELKYAFDPK